MKPIASPTPLRRSFWLFSLSQSRPENPRQQWESPLLWLRLMVEERRSGSSGPLSIYLSANPKSLAVARFGALHASKKDESMRFPKLVLWRSNFSLILTTDNVMLMTRATRFTSKCAVIREKTWDNTSMYTLSLFCHKCYNRNVGCELTNDIKRRKSSDIDEIRTHASRG